MWCIQYFRTAIKSARPCSKVELYPHPIAICPGEHGKLLVLDYAPLKNLTRLVVVRLHVPADVKVVRECHGAAKSLAYCDGIASVSSPTGIHLFSTAKKPTESQKSRAHFRVAEERTLHSRNSSGASTTALCLSKK